MIEILAIPALLVFILVMIHAWFGMGILQRNIIFRLAADTDLCSTPEQKKSSI